MKALFDTRHPKPQWKAGKDSWDHTCKIKEITWHSEVMRMRLADEERLWPSVACSGSQKKLILPVLSMFSNYMMIFFSWYEKKSETVCPIIAILYLFSLDFYKCENLPFWHWISFSELSCPDQSLIKQEFSLVFLLLSIFVNALTW